MLKSVGVAVLCAVLLFGCYKPPLASTEQALLGLTYQSIVEGSRDPASIQFSDLVWIDTPQSTAVCGKFNAANGYGGMVGPTSFVRRFLPEEIAFARGAVGKAKFDYAIPFQRAKAALAQRELELSRPHSQARPVLYREGDSNNLAYVDDAGVEAKCYDGKRATLKPEPLPLPPELDTKS